MKLCFFGWFTLGLASVALAGGSSFVGTYKGENVVMEIKETVVGQFAGTVVVDGESAPFTAREQAGVLVGTVTLDDEKVLIRLTLNGATLTLTSGEESETLVKQDTSSLVKTAADAPTSQELRVNGVVVDRERIRRLEKENGALIPRGNFWYDKASGAWGIASGPTVGFTAPGVDIGGPLREDASHGNTGVFINGRQLPLLDVLGLKNLGVPVQRGRWWMDHSGNFGVEGYPQLLGNVFQYSRGKGGSYQRTTAGGYIGSDGQTSYFFDPKTGSSVMTGP